MKLKDKTAVVTGASSGIGQETAVRLGKERVKVALLARRENRLEETAAEIEDSGGEAIVLKTDVTDERQVKAAIDETLNSFKSIDMLVNVAGMGIFKTIEDLSPAEWRRQIDVMLTGAFLTTHYALPHIYRSKQGRVLFLTSLWGPSKTAAACSAYNAAKAGVSALARVLREEVKEKKLDVGVTEVRPGTVATEFFDKAEYKGGPDPERALSAEDVASAIIAALRTRARTSYKILEMEAVNPPY